MLSAEERKRRNKIKKDAYIKDKMDLLSEFMISPSPALYNKLNSFDSIRAIDFCCLRLISKKLDGENII